MISLLFANTALGFLLFAGLHAALLCDDRPDSIWSGFVHDQLKYLCLSQQISLLGTHSSANG